MVDIQQKEDMVKKLSLMDFSANKVLTPELIDDALNSTSTFYENIDMADVAKRIRANKAKYGGANP